MSKEIVHAIVTTPALSSAAYARLTGIGSVDWAHLWTLIQQYGAPVIDALEIVLPKIAPGATWAEVVVLLIDELKNRGMLVQQPAS